jgi:hypothetical protein
MFLPGCKGVARFRLYDLRHTWATRATMSGIDLSLRCSGTVAFRWF